MRAIRDGFGAFALVAVLLAGTAVAAEVRDAPAPTEELPAGSRSSADGFAADGAATDGTAADGSSVDGSSVGGRENFGASCRTVVQGSRVTAYCQNPYPDTDRVRLHVECDRWWDVDTDSAPVDVGAADYAQISGRCWKEVGSAWVTHEQVEPVTP
ncbi:hypothetical protein AB0G79_30580 [Streptomyces sp. NPDC020807]|uniref:hypothetical protein n=1 Tax=Streptomyces sp. NPDC020807 TaxID=3155119 RepID=UPI0033FEFA85